MADQNAMIPDTERPEALAIDPATGALATALWTGAPGEPGKMLGYFKVAWTDESGEEIIRLGGDERRAE